jgi:hypothetical protein
MKTLPCLLRPKDLPVLFAIVVLLVPLCYGLVLGYDSPGIVLRIYGDQEHSQLQYILGQEPVHIVVVISNTAESPLLTERGFSQVELRHTLVITDPQGVKYSLSAGEMLHKMPIPFFLNDRPWGFAESLPLGWVRSVTIEDLTELVTVMKTKAGWYTIEAYQPFLRFASAGQDPGLGLLGLLDEPGNWDDTVKSNTMQIYLAPNAGALLAVKVLDGSVDPQDSLAQVPVKVIRTSDIPSDYTLQATWDKVKTVLEGTTNFGGSAVWKSDTSCVVQDNYSVLASYGGEIKSQLITAAEPGWLAGCTGSIQKTMVFGTLAPRESQITGAGFNFPETSKYRAVFSVNAISKDSKLSGKVAYNYTRTRMILNSTKITGVSVTGTTGRIKGEGSVNQAKGYTFEAVVVDGAPDQFGITIWKPNGVLHYKAATSALSGGELGITLK